MRYLWVSGKRPRMHVMRSDALLHGRYVMESLCSAPLPFDRSINAPYALGRPVCKHCLRVAQKHADTTETPE